MPTLDLDSLEVMPLPDLFGSAIINPSFILQPKFAVATLGYNLLVRDLTTHIQVSGKANLATDTIAINESAVNLNSNKEFQSALIEIPDTNDLNITVNVSNSANESRNYTVAVSRVFDLLKGVTVNFENVLSDLDAKRETIRRDIQDGLKAEGFDQLAAAWQERTNYGPDKMLSNRWAVSIEEQLQATRFNNRQELANAFHAGVLRIRKGYPDVPSSVANAAIIRYIGYLADAPHFTGTANDAGAWLKCGAESILKPYKKRRAVSAE